MRTLVNYTPEEKLRREAEAIRAMQYRLARWHGPVLNILWNKPWKSRVRPWHADLSVAANLRNFPDWLRNAHDCADPSVACSCSGGFRFPDLIFSEEA